MAMLNVVYTRGTPQAIRNSMVAMMISEMVSMPMVSALLRVLVILEVIDQKNQVGNEDEYRSN